MSNSKQFVSRRHWCKWWTEVASNPTTPKEVKNQILMKINRRIISQSANPDQK